MKRIVLVVVLLIAIGQIAGAQSREMAAGDSVVWELRKQSFIYNSARMFNDPQVAKMAIYNLLAENPGNAALYDSLALIYLQYGQYASSALVSQQSIRINPNNLFATEVAATSFDNLGVKDKAIPYYETLYLSNNDLSILYKISFLQMELARYGEAVTSSDIIMNNEESKELMIRFPTEDGNGQEVPLNVAAHRVKAMVEESKGNKAEAQKLYLKTLEMYPGFQIVQSQLQALNKKGE
ncbi:MAG: hypothetical protein RIM99_10960 [Cyclobacteriaceae bacterium]